MKTCPKCHNVYEDTSDICPKCGAFYKKKYKFPSIFKLIFYFYIYGIGFLILLSSMISINEDPVTSLLGFLFFLSLMKPIYTFYFNKLKIKRKYHLLIRIMIPLVLIIAIFSRIDIDDNKKRPNQSLKERLDIVFSKN